MSFASASSATTVVGRAEPESELSQRADHPFLTTLLVV